MFKLLTELRSLIKEVGLGDTTNGYDSFGRPSSITNRFGETSSRQYDSLGRVSKKTLNPGQYEDYSYDIRNRVTSVVLRNSANVALRTQSYSYNNASEVLSHTVAGVTTSYGYDASSQLTSESRAGYSATYSYDGNGNRLTRNISGGVNETYSYDDGDKLLSVNWSGGSKTYGYDETGRTTSVVSPAGTTSLAYDYESRLTSISGGGITAETYTYNGLDTRVSKTVSSVTTTYARNGAGVTAPVLRDSQASYTPGISERRGSVSTFSHGGVKNQDAQTGTAQIINATKQFDAFGNQTSSSGTWQGPFAYGGVYLYSEDTTGLKLLGSRYYDSTSGRFITRDKIKDGRNWYTYCDNNPVKRVDPNGNAFHDPVQITIHPSFGGVVIAIGDTASSGDSQSISIVSGGQSSSARMDVDCFLIIHPDGTTHFQTCLGLPGVGKQTLHIDAEGNYDTVIWDWGFLDWPVSSHTAKNLKAEIIAAEDYYIAPPKPRTGPPPGYGTGPISYATCDPYMGCPLY